jgi:hypothetical protein
MPRKSNQDEESKPRWMTQCDVIRYNLKIPDKLKAKLKKEAETKDMDMSSYICGVLAGEIKRSQKKK